MSNKTIRTVLCKSNKSEFRRISSNFDEYRRKPAIFRRKRKFFEVSKKFRSAIVLTCSIFRLIVRNIAQNFERYFVWWNEFSSEVSLSVSKFRMCVIKLKRNFVHFQRCFELTFAAMSWWQRQSKVAFVWLLLFAYIIKDFAHWLHLISQ